MEYQQHEISGRSDRNNLKPIFNYTTTQHDDGNRNDDTGTNTSQGGESNNAHDDGDCNENGGTQRGADSSGNACDNQTDESSTIPTSESITTPSSTIANSTRDSPVKNQASNTPHQENPKLFILHQ